MGAAEQWRHQGYGVLARLPAGTGPWSPSWLGVTEPLSVPSLSHLLQLPTLTANLLGLVFIFLFPLLRQVCDQSPQWALLWPPLPSTQQVVKQNQSDRAVGLQEGGRGSHGRAGWTQHFPDPGQMEGSDYRHSRGRHVGAVMPRKGRFKTFRDMQTWGHLRKGWKELPLDSLKTSVGPPGTLWWDTVLPPQRARQFQVMWD